MSAIALPAPHRRARLAVVAGLVALLLVAVFPPGAWLPGLVAVVLGADARERGRAAGRRDPVALVGMALGAVAIAVGIALVVSAAAS